MTRRQAGLDVWVRKIATFLDPASGGHLRTSTQSAVVATLVQRKVLRRRLFRVSCSSKRTVRDILITFVYYPDIHKRKWQKISVWVRTEDLLSILFDTEICDRRVQSI